MSLSIGTALTATSSIELVDESGNKMSDTASTADDVEYTVDTDTTGLFDTDGGLTLNKYSGSISGTPAKGISGSFRIKAEACPNTD
jgi:hypothetical protein